jgi:hypothetical protein
MMTGTWTARHVLRVRRAVGTREIERGVRQDRCSQERNDGATHLQPKRSHWRDATGAPNGALWAVLGLVNFVVKAILVTPYHSIVRGCASSGPHPGS